MAERIVQSSDSIITDEATDGIFKLRRAALTGAITASQDSNTTVLTDGAVTTAKIADLAVTGAKFANASITSAKIASGSVTGDKIGTDAVTETKIADNAVTSAKIADFAVIANKLASEAVATAKIAPGAVTNAKLADMVAATLKGRTTGGGTGAPVDLTSTEATAILDVFTSALKGLVPASGGGTATFLRADGTFAAPPITLLTSGTVSAQATLDLVLTSYTGYRALKLLLTSFVPATDDVELWLRTSTNGGSSYDAGASDYAYANMRGRSGVSTADTVVSNGAAQIIVAGVNSATFAVSNVAAEGGANCEIMLYNQSALEHTRIRIDSTFVGAQGDEIRFAGAGRRLAAQDTDAIRILFESGNIASGSYALYGLA
jgi:hypothetical protein